VPVGDDFERLRGLPAVPPGGRVSCWSHGGEARRPASVLHPPYFY
jgi:hypothetical protein